MISRPNYGMYECNFWHFYTIFTCAYDNQQKFDPKYNQGSKRIKKGQKGVKISGIWKNMISYPNYGTYECNFWHVYTIFKYAYDNIQDFDPKYNQRPKNGQKGSKIGPKWSKF